jgi:hypothetical protein
MDGDWYAGCGYGRYRGHTTEEATRMEVRQWLVVMAVAVGVVVTGVRGASEAQTLRVVSFNVESGGSDPTVVDDIVTRLQDVDLWGFSEIQNETWAGMFERAAEDGEQADFIPVLGTTGGRDRLLIVYDAKRFELEHINPGGRVRAPLVAHLRLKSTGHALLFMVNHLFRTDNAGRHEQARLLNAWARQQTLPIIAVGITTLTGMWRRARPTTIRALTQ